MSDTPILGITELAESQAGKAISVNEALHRLEGVLVRVLSATTTAEPGSPAEGDTYIVPDSATGTDWAGNDGKVAHYYGGAWKFYAPVEGLAIYSIGDAKAYRYLSIAWSEDVSGGASTFLTLTDTPSAYTGLAGATVKVNDSADGLAFVAEATDDGIEPGDVYAVEVLRDAPGAYYRLNETSGNLADSSGNDLTATMSGSPTYQADPPFGTDGAITWGGSAEALSSADAALGDATDDLAVECWAKWTSTTSPICMASLRSGGTGAQESMILHANLGSTGDIGVRHNGANVLSAGTGWNDGEWHHIVATKVGATLALYIDGVLDNSGAVSESSDTNTNYVRVAENQTAGQNFVGTLDEVAAYAGIVPVPGRIASHYNARLCPTARDSYADMILALAPIGHWRLGEPSGTTADDETGLNDGAYVGSPTLAQTGLLTDDADTAALFDADTERVSVPDIGLLFGPSGSIELWFKPNWSSGSSSKYLLVDIGTDTYFLRIIRHSTNDWYVGWKNDVTDYRLIVSDSSPAIVSGGIHHLVLTWDQDTTTTTLWINGEQVGTKTDALVVPALAATDDAALFADQAEENNANAVGDDVAIYSRVLSAAEIAENYAAGLGTFPAVATSTRPGRNYLLNPDFNINQRGFSGGSVADTDYCYDRWRANGSSSFSAVDGNGYVTLTSGTIEQEIEAPDLAGKQVTLAADTGGTTVTGDIDGTSGNLPLTVTIDPGSTGNIIVACTGGKLRHMRLVEGADAGLYQPRDPTLEHQLCRRYYAKSYPKDTAPGSVGAGNAYCFALTTSKSLQMGNVMAPVEMRASPTVTLYSPNDGTADAIYNETGTANHVAAAVNTTKNCIGYPQIDAGASAPSADDLFAFHWTADAEI